MERVHGEPNEDLEEVKHPVPSINRHSLENFAVCNEKNPDSKTEVEETQFSF